MCRLFPADKGEVLQLTGMCREPLLDTVGVGQFSHGAHCMYQHDVTVALPQGVRGKNGEKRPQGSAGRQHPQGLGLRHLVQNKEPCCPGRNLHGIAGLHGDQSRRERAARHHDKVKLVDRIGRAVDERVGPGHHLAIDFQRQACKLTRLERCDLRQQLNGIQLLRPAVQVDHTAGNPIRHVVASPVDCV
jgi:hypothetical protein